MQSIDSILTNYWYYALLLVAVLVVLVWYDKLKRINIFKIIEMEFFKKEKEKHVIGPEIKDVKEVDKGNPTPGEKKPSEIFARSDSAEFAGYFEQLAEKARRIVLIGIGINILHREPLFKRLVERVTREECNIEIYLANPFSPAIEMRLIEEEIGDMKPPVGKVGLINRLHSIIEEQKKNPSNFVLKMFSHYPTFAMFILDDDYFFYPYGYALLGNHSPVAHFSSSNQTHKPMIDFLKRQYDNVKASSADAQLVLDMQMGRRVSKEQLDKLKPFAVYLVPDESSEIYRFGSNVLGYDIRKDSLIKSDFVDHVDSANDFGFHLTVVDALYYACQRDIDLLRKEVEFVAKGLQPFSLSFKIRERFPNDKSISLECSDESGTLESLHYELVFRCYRQAVASNYSLGLAPFCRDLSPPRDRLMVQRYHAPYILQSFKPHFTLLDNVPADKMDEVAQELKERCHKEVKERQIKIKYIAVMTKPQMDKHWKIFLPEVPLG